MLAERLETIRQGADKRIPPDKRTICTAQPLICARRASWIGLSKWAARCPHLL